MKEFAKDHPGIVFVFVVFSFLLASDVVDDISQHGRPDCRACVKICGNNNVRSVTVSSCVCK